MPLGQTLLRTTKQKTSPTQVVYFYCPTQKTALCLCVAVPSTTGFTADQWLPTVVPFSPDSPKFRQGRFFGRKKDEYCTEDQRSIISTRYRIYQPLQYSRRLVLPPPPLLLNIANERIGKPVLGIEVSVLILPCRKTLTRLPCNIIRIQYRVEFHIFPGPPCQFN